MVRLARSDSPPPADAFGALAQPLAQALRSTRLTVVVTAHGDRASALLALVQPLLRRRATDAAATDGAEASGVVLPFPDRRHGTGDAASREVIHAMAHWDDESLQALQRTLDDTVAGRARRPVADAMTPGSLADHIERHGGARLLFVFDRFGQLLESARKRPMHRRLIETWAATLRSPQLRANFLVAVDERSWPWLHAVCAALPPASWSALRLLTPTDGATLEPMTRTPPPALPAGRTPHRLSTRVAQEPTGAQFLQSVNERMRRVAQSARAPTPAARPARSPADVAAVPPRAVDSPAPPVAAAPPAPVMTDHAVVHDAATNDSQIGASTLPPPIDEPVPSMPLPGSTPAAPSAPRPALRPALRLGLVALVIGAGLAVAIWHAPTGPQADGAGTPPVAAAPTAATVPQVQAAAPAAAPTAPSGGAFDAIGVSAGGEHARLAGELAAALSGDGPPVRVEPLAGELQPVAWLQQAPGRLGIAHYDALRAAAPNASAAALSARGVPLQVLTPLVAEPVLFIVRANSPLRTLRQLGDKRIAVGPAYGDAAHTVRAVLRRLLGAAPAQTVTLAPQDAVAELVAFQTIDAIAVVDAQPMAWWNTLEPSTARRLRVLTLDPTNARDGRLLDAMGTQPLHVRLPGAQGGVALVPAVMSYLVASGLPDAPGEAGAERLAAMAQALCRELPQLQQQGHGAWRELRPLGQTDTGWPVMGAFRTAVSRCARG